MGVAPCLGAFLLFLCNKYTVWFSCKSTVGDVLHFIVISSVLTIFVLEKDGHEKVKNIRVMLFSFISICYVLSSAFSASLFLQLSNMDLSSSPWLEFTWKLSSFFVLIFFILQLTTYVIFIVTADHAKGYRLLLFWCFDSNEFNRIICLKQAGCSSILCFKIFYWQ